MYPTLIELGPIPVYTYGVILAAAYLTGLWFAARRARERGLDSARVMDLGIIVIISAVVGAKLMLLIVEFDHYRANPGDLWALVRAAGVFYGGLLLAVGVSFWFMRRYSLPLWATCDAFAPGIALGQAIGRIGCLMAGCCYGSPTSLPWGITFTNPLAAGNVGAPLDVALHPTQLYEAGAALLILAVLLLAERRGSGPPGRTFWRYIFLYAATRLGIEYFRGDPRGTVFDLLSTSQFVSLLLIPVSLAMLLALRRSRPDTPRGQQPQPRAA